ncbi:hypothetical protein MMC18_000244 [Xylographa bjoerkii]|nr:hypothetical protein [Xylographa bjoerkii]
MFTIGTSLLTKLATHYAAACPHAPVIAALHNSRLLLRSSIDGTILRSFQLDTVFAARCRRIKWFKLLQRDRAIPNEGVQSIPLRLLLSDEETVYVFDLSDPKWHATINGAARDIGKIVNVDFGYTKDEVVVFSDFGLKVIIWSLLTNRGVEVRDPKFSYRGHSFRSISGHVAILARETMKDAVMVLAPATRKLASTFSLATVDAQGLEWSPDGRWLVTWEAASAGFHVLLYTADGHLFKNYFGGQDPNIPGLGVRTVEWDPGGKFLAVGSYDSKIHLLSTQNFHCIATLLHSGTIHSLSASIWQEQIDASRSRSYITAPQPACPPSQVSTSNDKPISTGISHLTFNGSGSLIVSRSDLTPSTVWIWSLESLTLHSVLIHHSTIKSLQWHPGDSDCLLVHCATEDPVIHIWQSSSESPCIISIPLSKPGGRTEASWVQCSDVGQGNPVGMLTNTFNYALQHVLDAGDCDETVDTSLSASIEGLGPEDMFDEGNSMDLSPIKLSHEQVGMGLEAASDEVDDTFDYRRHIAN